MNSELNKRLTTKKLKSATIATVCTASSADLSNLQLRLEERTTICRYEAPFYPISTFVIYLIVLCKAPYPHAICLGDWSKSDTVRLRVKFNCAI